MLRNRQPETLRFHATINLLANIFTVASVAAVVYTAVDLITTLWRIR